MEPVYGITPRSPTGTTCRPLTTPCLDNGDIEEYFGFKGNFEGTKVPPCPVRPAVIICPGKGDGDIGGLSVLFKVFIPS